MYEPVETFKPKLYLFLFDLQILAFKSATKFLWVKLAYCI